MSTYADYSRKFVEVAHSIAFDGCHKIYILMDEEQTNKMVEYDYQPVRTDQFSDLLLVKMIEEWWSQSCPLVFIQAVRSGPEGDEFFDVVSQMREIGYFDDFLQRV